MRAVACRDLPMCPRQIPYEHQGPLYVPTSRESSLSGLGATAIFHVVPGRPLTGMPQPDAMTGLRVKRIEAAAIGAQDAGRLHPSLRLLDDLLVHAHGPPTPAPVTHAFAPSPAGVVTALPQGRLGLAEGRVPAASGFHVHAFRPTRPRGRYRDRSPRTGRDDEPRPDRSASRARCQEPSDSGAS